MLEAKLDMIRQMIKIDISTGDIITPEAVEYSYKLMFENRSISLWTYNLETMLGEKLETIMARENANTRMRDFYDIFILTEEKNVDYKILYSAFMATSEKRETTTMISRFDSILDSVLNDAAMRKMWDMYRDENYFVGKTYENAEWMVWYFDTQDEQINFFNYLRLKTVRFLLSLTKATTRIITGKALESIPWMNFKHAWSEKELCELWGIDKEMWDYINNFIDDYYDDYKTFCGATL